MGAAKETNYLVTFKGFRQKKLLFKFLLFTFVPHKNRRTTCIKTGTKSMAKSYPRFLFSNPSNVKKDGSYIIHTLEPRFIVRPEFDAKRNIIDCHVLEVWSEDHDRWSIQPFLDEIPKWFKLSGVQQSTNHDDVLLAAILPLPFLIDRSTHFSVEEAKTLIKLLFPSKTKTFYEGSSSYGLKHLFEHISMTAFNERFKNKYCSNQTVIQAFEEEGYRWKQEGPNRYMNISAREVNRAYKLFWNT
ncbi:MAG TPA: hypothetical protein VF455_00540 [Chryseobacterium sp.]